MPFWSSSDARFVHYWAKARQRGRAGYMVREAMTYAVLYSVAGIGLDWWMGREIGLDAGRLVGFLVFGGFFAFFLNRVWRRNEERYARLVVEKVAETFD